MELRLKFDEDFSGGIVRLIAGECESALHLMTAQDVDPHEIVHEFRKSGKKIRSALRLIRDRVDFYQRENTFFRDLARHVSDVRDAKANIETLDKLYALHEGQLAEDSFRSIREYLEATLRDQETIAFGENDILNHIREALEQKLGEIETWHLDIPGVKPVTEGIRRTYRRGRKALKKARKTQNTSDFHQYRKRVKYLRYQLDILSRIWPGTMATLENELHDVSDWTGFDHDLYNLSCSVGPCEEAFASPEQRRLFHALVSHQRALHKQTARLKGERLYIDRPGDFKSKLDTYWKCHREEVHSRYPTAGKLLE